MRARILLVLLYLLPALSMAAPPAQPLQPWLDLTPAGGVLRLAPGTYAGPAVISKPLTLEGAGKVVIDGGGRGTVLTIRADDVTLRGLHLRGSGGSHDALDGGESGFYRINLLTGEATRVGEFGDRTRGMDIAVPVDQ